MRIKEGMKVKNAFNQVGIVIEIKRYARVLFVDYDKPKRVNKHDLEQALKYFKPVNMEEADDDRVGEEKNAGIEQDYLVDNL